MLYHPAGNELIWGVKCKFAVFEDAEIKHALNDGWFESVLDFDKKKAPKSKKVKADDNEG